MLQSYSGGVPLVSVPASRFVAKQWIFQNGECRYQMLQDGDVASGDYMVAELAESEAYK
jgi:hypothetical protein